MRMMMVIAMVVMIILGKEEVVVVMNEGEEEKNWDTEERGGKGACGWVCCASPCSLRPAG